ncbi:MAG: hypothetical protein NZ959_09165 [Armatimonadetes bacterium]|nr:hypothetical protein [Armatimonadota bacterium]MDW8122788.1 hypothetical protein [Armatimonadota bacterium]
MSPTEEKVSLQLHLRVGPESLPWLTREISRTVLAAHLGREPTEEELARSQEPLREFLRTVITAYDLCGLTSLCWEAEEVDPWTMVEETPTQTKP